MHKIQKIMGLFFAIAILGGLMIACSESDKSSSDDKEKKSASEKTAPKSEKEFIKISAVDLFKQYEENQVKADKDLKGKWVEINGSILDFGKDMLTDEPNVKLDVNKDDMGLSAVECTFRDTHTDEIAEMSKGQEVTLRGKVEGKPVLNVIVHYCELVK